jgi:hypothetical protein
LAAIAHEALWEQLQKLQPQETARRADCVYEGQSGRYAVRFVGTAYSADPGLRQILEQLPGGEWKEAGYLEQLCILAYLINAKERPPAGRMAGPAGLTGGEFFFRGLHSLPTDKLSKAFGNNPQRLLEAAERLGAVPRNLGDAGVEVPILPRVRVMLLVWRGDEEFQPRASILFDHAVGEQLPLDALLTAVNIAVDKLLKLAAQLDSG